MRFKRISLAMLFLCIGVYAQHSEHHHDMNARGEKAMGFSQTSTTHHFKLLS